MTEKTFHEIEHAAWSARASEYDALFAQVAIQAIGPILTSVGPGSRRRHLDVACGTGHLVAAASRRGWQSEGVDFAQPMIDVARTTYPQDRFRLTDATALPHADQSLDAVTCSFGLSHMEEPQTAMREAFRVLKGGGCFAFTLWYGATGGNESQQIVQAALAALATVRYSLPAQWTQLRDADRQVCAALVKEAGFAAPEFRRLPIFLQTPSAQCVLELFTRLSIRTKTAIELQPPAVQRRIHEYILAEAEARRTNGIISLAWPALLTVVHKPE